ncbi:unannotated protein [freshwater metagenome]|uniref:Unannotated protein n=1 Tax=freshwater metagenome TaxID=449393 RepID=A0A6J7XQ16_9ZZZZ|nr:nicotinamide-nucleotide amidohydrolase family protein [Actinomycetota bacterium]
MSLAPDSISLVREIIENLRHCEETLSTAESLTGGALSSAITSVPGASHVFLGGISAYTREVKEKFLLVPPSLIDEKNVVSEEVAIAMAQGALRTFNTTWAIATTGVAGPGPSGGVGAGTVWVAVAGPVNQVIELSLEGEREIVRNATVASAIATFARILRHRKP